MGKRPIKTALVAIERVMFVGGGIGRDGSDYVSVQCEVSLQLIGAPFNLPIYECQVGDVMIGRIFQVSYTPSSRNRGGRGQKYYKPRVDWQIEGGNHRLHYKSRKEAIETMIRDYLRKHPGHVSLFQSVANVAVSQCKD